MFAFLFLNKEICRIDGGISQFDMYSDMREEKREFDAQLSNCCVDFCLGKRQTLLTTIIYKSTRFIRKLCGDTPERRNTELFEQTRNRVANLVNFKSPVNHQIVLYICVLKLLFFFDKKL